MRFIIGYMLDQRSAALGFRLQIIGNIEPVVTNVRECHHFAPLSLRIPVVPRCPRTVDRDGSTRHLKSLAGEVN